MKIVINLFQNFSNDDRTINLLKNCSFHHSGKFEETEKQKLEEKSDNHKNRTDRNGQRVEGRTDRNGQRVE